MRDYTTVDFAATVRDIDVVLERIADAHRLLDRGHLSGKLVLTV